MALSTIQTNAARLGQRLQETIHESTRDLAAFAPASYSHDELTKLLQSSSSDRDKLNALKHILTLPPAAQHAYFPTLIKLISSQNVHFKALLYPFIAIHAPTDPDLTLLAINSITKDLRHPSNVYIRILALRTLTRIQPAVSGILPLVVDAITVAARDSNAYLRNQAAISLASLPPSPSLLPILNSLLLNPCPSTAVAFFALAPSPTSNVWLLFHTFYRTYCNLLSEFPPWSQITTLNLLGIYARLHLSPSDPDTTLLIASSKPLLYSLNPPTILAALRAHHLLTSTFPEPHHIQAFQALLRTQNVGIQQAVLTYILHLLKRAPAPFKPMLGQFLVRAADNHTVALVKLRILSVLLATQPVDTALLQRLITEFSVCLSFSRAPRVMLIDSRTMFMTRRPRSRSARSSCLVKRRSSSSRHRVAKAKPNQRF
jgi:vesicle coat complex subunit